MVPASPREHWNEPNGILFPAWIGVIWLWLTNTFSAAREKQEEKKRKKGVSHPFFLFGRTERPDRTGTNSRLFYVDGHHRRWMWTPICRGTCNRYTVRADSAGEAPDSEWTRTRVFRLELNEWPRTASSRSARSHALWWELRHALRPPIMVDRSCLCYSKHKPLSAAPWRFCCASVRLSFHFVFRHTLYIFCGINSYLLRLISSVCHTVLDVETNNLSIPISLVQKAMIIAIRRKHREFHKRHDNDN